MVWVGLLPLVAGFRLFAKWNGTGGAVAVSSLRWNKRRYSMDKRKRGVWSLFTDHVEWWQIARDDEFCRYLRVSLPMLARSALGITGAAHKAADELLRKIENRHRPDGG